MFQPGFAAPAPAVGLPPAGRDAEMLAALEGNLAAMNTAVTAKLLEARHQPPPGPPLPGSRRFFRIRATVVDSDGDGSDDVSEMEMLANAGSNPAFALANPFDADANHDGIPDGDQLDADQDGTPDSKDLEPANAQDATERIEVPRFAFFNVQGRPLAINDRGTVLFETSTWGGGQSIPLTGALKAVGINDSDTILGWNERVLAPRAVGQPPYIPTLCFWRGRGATMQYVQKVASPPVWAYAQFSQSHGFYSNALTNDDVCGGTTFYPIDGTGVNDGFNSWQLSAGAGSSNPTGRQGNTLRGLDANLYWAGDGSRFVYVSGHETQTRFITERAIRDSKHPGRIIAFDSLGSAQVSQGGGWSDYAKYDHAIDATDESIALGNYGVTDPAGQPIPALPLQINGEWFPITRTAPGLPERWTQPDVDPFSALNLIDCSPKGWMLAERGPYTYSNEGLTDETYPEKEAGVLLPIRLKGVAPDDKFKDATGVDDLSLTSKDPDMHPITPETPADYHPVKDRFWIMAPFGSDGHNYITLKAPLNANTPLTLEAPGVKFGTGSGYQLTSEANTFEVIGNDQNVSGQDSAVTLKLGSNASLSTPVGVKVMRQRIIPINVWLISSDKNPAGLPPWSPDYKTPERPNFNETEDEIELYLNKIFNPQLNILFHCTIRRDAIAFDTFNGLNYGLPADALGPLTNNLNTTPQLGGEMDAIREKCLDANACINLYVPAKAAFITTSVPYNGKVQGTSAAGLANPNLRICAIADAMGNNGTKEVLETMAHEIGHVMLGAGHPDEADSGKFGGVAPLPGTDHHRRLMASGNVSKSCKIVKAEWDKAERWLQLEELAHRAQH